MRADAEALETILGNLISNALKYGGTPPALRVRVRAGEGHGILEVQDAGAGIDEAEATRIFDPFVRGQGELIKQRPGIGLGLHLVAELTASMGGQVSARNVGEPQGFVISVKLPSVKRREEDR